METIHLSTEQFGEIMTKLGILETNQGSISKRLADGDGDIKNLNELAQKHTACYDTHEKDAERWESRKKVIIGAVLTAVFGGSLFEVFKYFVK